MLEGLRRQMARRREEAEKAKLKEIERKRRLSYISMKRLQTRKGAEEELRTQKVSEITTFAEAREALAERKRAERELRQMTPGIARRTARVAKRAFYDTPVKTIKAFQQPGAGARMRRIAIGDPELLFGRRKPVERTSERAKPKQTMNAFVFGKPPDSGESDITKDILS